LAKTRTALSHWVLSIAPLGKKDAGKSLGCGANAAGQLQSEELREKSEKWRNAGMPAMPNGENTHAEARGRGEFETLKTIESLFGGIEKYQPKRTQRNLTRRHGDTERGASAAGQLKSEELREKSEKWRIFRFCQCLAKTPEFCQTLAKVPAARFWNFAKPWHN
jgi:hypothetical protein